MKRLFFSLLVLLPLLLSIFTHTPTATNAQGRAGAVVKQTCHAEVRWNYSANLRRGPGTNFGVLREILWNNSKLRVFGRNEAGDWYQVALEEPAMLGWVWLPNINLFGNCTTLPITEDNPEPAKAPSMPPDITLPEWADTLKFTQNDSVYLMNDGMLYMRHENPDTKQQLHMVIADLDAPQLRVESYIGAVPNNTAKLISEMVAETGALVAINGDFYGGNYMPQGLTVIDNKVVTAPKFRSTFAITADNEPFIGYFTRNWSWGANMVAEDGEVIPLQLMNLPCNPDWLCVYSDAIQGLPFKAGYDQVRVLLSPELEILSIGRASGYMEIPKDHFALHAGTYSATGEWVNDHLKVGDTVTLNLLTEPAWQDYEYAISGGPLIVADGEFYQDCDPELPEEERSCEEFDDNFRQTHYFGAHTPRTAVGFNSAENILFMVVAEGYDVGGGMTQRELADIFLQLGADYAMEFDGGGSSGMWIDNGFVNDFGPRGERRLSNALMLFWEED